MKKLFLLGILIVSNLYTSLAQDIQAVESIRIEKILLSNVKRKEVGTIDLKDIAGTPYFKSDNFLPSIINFDNYVIIDSLYLRYNIYSDEFEISNDKVTHSGESLSRKENIIPTIENLSFYYIEYSDSKMKPQKGYLIKLYNDDNFTLYKKLEKTYKPEVIAESSLKNDMPARFVDGISYYLKQKNYDAHPYFIKKKVSSFKIKNKDDLAKIKSMSKRLKKFKSDQDYINFFKALAKQ